MTNYIKIFNVSANLLLIYVVIISLYLDDLEAGIIAMIVGLMKDIIMGSIFGLNALILFFIAYYISHIKQNIYKESYITIFALVFLASLFDSTINILTAFVVYNTYSIITLLLKGVVFIPILNSLLSLILYKIFKPNIYKLKQD
jgi:rod shape-determining protein MreD